MADAYNNYEKNILINTNKVSFYNIQWNTVMRHYNIKNTSREYNLLII